MLRAFGSNYKILAYMGRPTQLLRLFGLALSNMLAALGGILTAQINGYADVNMGVGMALTAIGAVVIGQQLLQNIRRKKYKFSAGFDCLSCFIGAFLYFLIMNVFLTLGLDPIYLKFMLGLVIIIFLGTASYSRGGRVHAFFHTEYQ